MLTVLLAIIAALLPVGLLYFYIQRKDRLRPEPKKQLIKGGLYGLLSVPVAILLAELTAFFFPAPDSPFLSALYTAFFQAGIPEEGAKLLMLYLLLRNNPYFDEHLDGIIYATCIGLGFAGLENILYVFASFDNFVTTAVVRGLFSVPAHFFFAVVMGYFYSLAHFSNREHRGRMLVLAFAVPMLLHGTFDAILMLQEFESVLSSLLVILFLWFCHKFFTKGRMLIAQMKEKDDKDYSDNTIC